MLPQSKPWCCVAVCYIASTVDETIQYTTLSHCPQRTTQYYSPQASIAASCLSLFIAIVRGESISSARILSWLFNIVVDAFRLIRSIRSIKENNRYDWLENTSRHGVPLRRTKESLRRIFTPTIINWKKRNGNRCRCIIAFCFKSVIDCRSNKFLLQRVDSH